MSANHRELVEKLASPVAEVRDEAKRDLVSAGKAAVPALVDGLGSPEREIRAGSALCLGRIGFVGAARVLHAMAEGDPDPSVRPLALRALTDLAGPEAPPDVRDALLSHLHDDDVFCRALACQGLGRIGDEASHAGLRQALNDDESWVREAAHRALEPGPTPAAGERSQQTALTRTGGSAALAPLAAQLGSPDAAQRQEARRMLVEQGQAAVATVARLLWNELSPGRRTAVEVLGAIGGDAAMEHLAALLDDPSARDLRAPALHAIARALERPGAAPAGFPAQRVRKLLEGEDDAMVRAAAARALVVAGGPGRAVAMELALTDREEWVRLTAAQALAGAVGPGDHALAGPLLRHLEAATEDDTQLVLPLLAALDHVVPDGEASAEAMGLSRFFIHHEEPRVRLAAAGLVARGAAPDQVDEATVVALLDLLAEVPELDPDLVQDAGGSQALRIRLVRAVGRLARPATSTAAVEALGNVLRTRAEATSERAEARV